MEDAATEVAGIGNESERNEMAHKVFNTVHRSITSVQFSRSVLTDSWRPHELQHARPLCPSPTPGVHSDSRPSSQWYHPVISSSVVPFSSCLQSFPASGSFPMSQFFASDSQNIGISASASVLPMNIQDWFPWGLTDLMSLQAKGLSRVFSNNIVQKHQFFGGQLSFIVQLSHPYMTTGKTIALTRWTFVCKVMSLLFNMLSRLVIGEGNGTPLQYSCLENPMDGGAWWAAVHGVAKSRTRLSHFTFIFSLSCIGEGNGNPLVFLPGESQGLGSLVGCHLWGRTESDTTEVT